MIVNVFICFMCVLQSKDLVKIMLKNLKYKEQKLSYAICHATLAEKIHCDVYYYFYLSYSL